MDLSLQSIKTNNWSAVNLKKTHHLNEMYTWACITVRWYWSVGSFFDKCQLTMTWMSIRISTSKLNTQLVMPGHYKKTANQSVRSIIAV